ncbi:MULTISPECIES: hypothetical protein [Halomicrobium]|uniref:Uncharacterized protein n=2 Tax=Halomicrobium mukohataei TaxID=57705 RepID=C7P3E4_HALMD|nr:MULTISPECIES: hypothetical protein [Halomicrobium]ACV47616.1 conserved hypothetical protein [Halomicrobium mukohataei DSM 12286]QCD66074.1 hypothetical protein E5139_10640 [Halomicrobium mukohataei]QFR20879.1 hypothetical protein GBQ70_10635 [Halomicrobium sp. ZPS1]
MNVAGYAVEPGRTAVGVLVGTAGLLFLAQPITGPIDVGGVPIQPALAAPIVLAAGLALGAFVFYRQGYALFAAAHAVFAVSLVGFVGGVALGSDLLLVVGVAALVGGAGWLVTIQRRAS